MRNTVAKNLNAFRNGSEGNSLTILGDGFTTAINNFAVTGQDEAIITNTAANKLLAANKVYRFTRFVVGGVGKWYEDA